MILYCITHGANILRAIIHKFKFHPQDEVVFIVDKGVSTLYCPKIEKIKYYQMPDPFEIADPDLPTEKIKEKTNEVLSEYFKKIDIDPRQASHIYVMFDVYNPFIVYFEVNSIKYMAIEFGRSQFYFFANNIDHLNTLKYKKVIKEMHLHDATGKNCVKAFLYSVKSRRETLEGKVEMESYDFYVNITSPQEELKRQLIEGYHLDKYDFDAVMLLNSQAVSSGNVVQFGAAMPYRNIDDDPNGAFYSFYKTVFDYYFNDVDFVLKLHPESDEKFEKAFSEFKQLPKEVPMEAFILLGKKFDIFCPAKSTTLGIYKARGFNIVYFELNIFNFIRQIHFVFLSSTLINAICPPMKIYMYGIDPMQMDNFKKWVFPDFKDVEFVRLDRDNVRNAVFVMADDPTADFLDMIRYAQTDCLILFNGSRVLDERLFAKQEMIYSIIDVSEEEEVDMRKCCWTVASKNRQLVDILRDFSASYVLERSKMRIQSEPHN